MNRRDLRPREIVRELDRYIVGQEEAKRAVAIALRNRYRRKRISTELRDEVAPKNILMIGPTGVGKTEIARRLAKLVNAPFIKVEATRFTEIGYVGRDVEGMVRDLVETAVQIVKTEKVALVADQAGQAANHRLVDLLAPLPRREEPLRNPLEFFLGGTRPVQQALNADSDYGGEEWQTRQTRAHEQRQIIAEKLRRLELEDESVEVEVEDRNSSMFEVFSRSGMEEMGINLQDLLGNWLPKKKKQRRVRVSEARRMLAQEEADKLVDMDEIISEAVSRSEQEGIIFIDEIDKIAGKEQVHGPDVSREGVQRDILPIVEGSTVQTKYGPVKSDHILFIAAGAFHVSKPSDLIPELQGRFPIRVELSSLTEKDFYRILLEPQNSLIRQYTALLMVDGVELRFTEEGIAEIAAIARKVNAETEDIGARRLHTVLERCLQDLLFEAPDNTPDFVEINASYVRGKVGTIAQDQDLTRYIL